MTDEDLKSARGDTVSYPDLYMEEFLKKYKHVETPEDYHDELNMLHVQYFRKDLEYLREHIAHYRKLAERWKRLSMVMKYANGTLTVIGSIGAILVVSVASLGALTLPLTIGFAGMGVAANVGDNGLNLITANKIKKYKNYLRILEKANDELFLFHRKAMSDTKISDEELKMSKDILEKCKKEIGKIGVNTENKHNDVDLKKMLNSENIESLKILLNKL